MKRLALLSLVLLMGAAQPQCPVSVINPIKVVSGVCFRTFLPPGSGEDRPWAEVKIMWTNAALLSFGNGEIPLIARFNGMYEQFGTVRTVQNPYRVPPGPDMLVQFDIAKVTEQNAVNGGGILPNGLPIPLGAADAETIFKLPLNNPNTPPKDYIYFAADENYLMLGTTVQIPAFDKYAAYSPLPLWLGIPVIKTETGQQVFNGGLYTSPTTGLNGVGAFFDVSDIYNIGADPICRGDNGGVSSDLPTNMMGMRR